MQLILIRVWHHRIYHCWMESCTVTQVYTSTYSPINFILFISIVVYAVVFTWLSGVRYIIIMNVIFVLAPDVTLLDPYIGAIPGTLFITNYKIYFRASPSEKTEVWISCYLINATVSIILNIKPLYWMNVNVTTFLHYLVYNYSVANVH